MVLVKIATAPSLRGRHANQRHVYPLPLQERGMSTGMSAKQSIAREGHKNFDFLWVSLRACLACIEVGIYYSLK